MKKRSVNSIKRDYVVKVKNKTDEVENDLNEDEILGYAIWDHFGIIDSSDLHELCCEKCEDFLFELCGGRGLTGDDVIKDCMIPLINSGDWQY
jgi:hypothetical protein